MTNFLLQVAQIFLAILTKTNLATFGQRLGDIGHIQLAKVVYQCTAGPATQISFTII